MKRNNSLEETPVYLCFDPSLTAFGWAVVRGFSVIDHGCIKTVPASKKEKIPKSMDKCRRISEINSVFSKILHEHAISQIVSEQPHGSQSAPAATALGIMLGVVQSLSDFYKIPLEWYHEGSCKQNALGKRAAEKEEMVESMSLIYDHLWSGIHYRDEAVADSLAVHNLHIKLNNL